MPCAGSTLRPSPESPASGPGWADIEAAIGRLRPDVLTAPYVMLGGTDGRHAHRITDRVYRFAPFRMSKAQRESIHSFDEHLGVDDFLAGVRWYARLIERLPG